MIRQDIRQAAVMFVRCASFDIVSSWVTFLRTILRNAPAQMGEVLTGLVLVLEVSGSALFPDVVAMIVDLAARFVAVGEAQLSFARANGWHVSLIKFLFKWYQTHKDITTLDFRCIFVLMMKFLPVLTQACVVDLQTLTDAISKSPVHTPAFFALLQAISDR
jgi:hypothetical protein